MIRLALFQPDIPQNAGAMLRMAACLGVAVDIIEPAGFPTSDRAFRRAGMDYIDHCDVARHASWAAFEAARRADGRRLLLLTTRGDLAHVDCAFAPNDTLLLGRESVGAPEHVHAAADLHLRVPMRPGLRSLNVAVAAAIVTAEALRQIGGWPRG